MSADTHLQATSVAELAAFIDAHPKLFVLTGAGLSAGSGIPTYRDRDAQWQRNAPITHQQFRGSEAARKRYWARSMAGWPMMGRAQPNAAHRAIASMEADGRVASVVTQNVDGLHQRAGSRDVIELHGSIGSVLCLDCGAHVSRADVQVTLITLNPDFVERAARMAPDGDADVELPSEEFSVPPCPYCHGTLKPDVVFFGDNVPRERVERSFAALDDADAMLVVGSSLVVYSGFRFCERAAARGLPIALVNQGRTRADSIASLKVDADCMQVLPEVARQFPMRREEIGLRGASSAWTNA